MLTDFEYTKELETAVEQAADKLKETMRFLGTGQNADKIFLRALIELHFAITMLWEHTPGSKGADERAELLESLGLHALNLSAPEYVKKELNDLRDALTSFNNQILGQTLTLDPKVDSLLGFGSPAIICEAFNALQGYLLHMANGISEREQDYKLSFLGKFAVELYDEFGDKDREYFYTVAYPHGGAVVKLQAWAQLAIACDSVTGKQDKYHFFDKNEGNKLVKAIFENVNIRANPILLAHSIAACNQLHEKFAFEPIGLSEDASKSYQIALMKQKATQVIQDSQARQSAGFFANTNNTNNLALAKDGVTKAKSLQELNTAMDTLFKAYEMQGGIYSIINFFRSIVAYLTNTEVKSLTQQKIEEVQVRIAKVSSQEQPNDDEVINLGMN